MMELRQKRMFLMPEKVAKRVKFAESFCGHGKLTPF